MTRYRLPDDLGGGEYEGGFATFAGSRYLMFELPDEGGQFYVHESAVTPVPPPLPEEPTEPRTIVWSGLKDGRGGVWEKSNSGWWYAMGDPGHFTWADVCAYGSPVRLVPEPFAERVDLPWEGKSKAGYRLRVREYLGDVMLGLDGGKTITAETARAMARALWAAADVAEAVAA